MIGPKPTETVWLPSAGATVVHDALHGPSDHISWRTPCGEVIRRVEPCWQWGALVSWRLLDHERVRPCRRCWR